MKDLLNYFEDLNKQTRVQCAEKYRELLLLSETGEKVDWEALNMKIRERWSISGLQYVKEKAWIRKTANGRTTWITAWNRHRELKVYMIGMRDFWASGRVGFSEYQDAINHVEKIKTSIRA